MKRKKFISIIAVCLALIMAFDVVAVAAEPIAEEVTSIVNSESSPAEKTDKLNHPDPVEDDSIPENKNDSEARLPEVAEKPPEPDGELVETEKYYKVYKTEERLYTTVYSETPNFYTGIFGIKHDYDNTLVLNEELFSTDFYETKSSNIDVKLPVSMNDGEGVTVKYNGVKLTLTPVSGDYSTSGVKENAILYNDVYDGIDIQYTMYELGLKEDIILNKYTGINKFSYVLDTHGDVAKLEDNAVKIYKSGQDEPSYTIAAPMMTDADGKYSENLKLSLTKDSKENLILTVTADSEWISDPQRSFPIKIDPNVSVQHDNMTMCILTQNKDVYPSHAYGYAGYVTPGVTGIPDAPLFGAARMYYKFNTNFADVIPEGADIKSATFNVYQYTDNSNAPFECHMLNGTFNENTLTWAEGAKILGAPSGQSFVSGSKVGMHNFDITDAVNEWVNGLSTQYGLVIKAQDESSNNLGSAFFTPYSVPGQNPQYSVDNLPRVEIEWELPNPVSPGITVNDLTINLRPICDTTVDGTMHFYAMFADGVSAVNSNVNYQLNDASKNVNGTVIAAPSYKYPSTELFESSFPKTAKKYRGVKSNWQTTAPFTNFAFNTLYSYSATASKNGAVGPTITSDTFLAYKIKQFDTLTKIANYYGVPYEQLAYDNYAIDNLVIADNTIVVINPTRNANKPYNPEPLGDSSKREIDALLMGRGKHCEFGFEPINLNTGNFYFDTSDISIPDFGGKTFDVNRTYNSKAAGMNGLFGRGWSFEYDESLARNADGSFIYKRGDGSSVVLRKNSDGTYSSPDGYNLTLSIKSAGTQQYVYDDTTYTVPIYTYEIKDASGEVRSFDNYGLLVSIKDADGFITSISYDENHNISKIESASGSVYQISVNDDGYISEIVIPNGGKLQYAYDENNNLTGFTDADGNTITYAYDENHRMISWANANGETTTVNEYDSLGRVVKQTDGEGNVTTLAYSDGQTVTTDANGFTTVYMYDDNYRTTKIEYADGTTELKTYDSKNNLASFTDANENKTEYKYDEKGNVISETRFDGKSQTKTYNGAGKVTSETDFAGNTTKYFYDENTDLIKIENPDGTTVTYTYNDKHQPLSMTDENGNTTLYSYTGANLASVTDALNNKTEYYYNSVGLLITKKTADGATARYTYSNMGRKLTEIYPDSGVKKYEFDKAGNVVSITDPKGYVFSFEYDTVGNVLSSTDPNGYVLQYEYDGLYNKVKETDGLGNVTKWTYDCKGNSVTETDANGNTAYYEYDGVGNLVSVTDRMGYVTTSEYDLRFNKLKKEVSANGEIKTYEYDLVGNMVKETKASGFSSTYEYNSRGFVLSKTDSTGLVTSYSYDNVGNITGVSDNFGRNKAFEYDAVYNLISEEDELSGTTSYTYDAVGNVLTKTNALEAVTTYTYDSMGRELTRTDSLGREYKRTYDLNGNVQTETAPNGGVSEYVYNCYDLVSKVTDAKGNYTLYAYDPNENIISETDVYGNTEKYEYTKTGLLSKMTDKLGYEYTFSYDKNGNNTEVKAPNGEILKTEYDCMGRAVKETYANGLVKSSVYSNRGLLSKVTDNSGTNDIYEYDNSGRLKKYTNALMLTEEYEYDIADNLTSKTGQDKNTTRYTYDAAGNVLTETDAENRKTTYTYDLLSNLIKEVDFANRTYTYEYDSENRLLTSVNPLGGKQTVEYNSLDLPVAVTNENGDKKLLEYDNLGNLMKEVDYEGNETSFVYDALYRMTEKKNPDSGSEEYEYDALSQVTKFKDPENGIYSYTYDSIGNVTSLKTPNGGLYTYQYDIMGNLKSEKDPLEGVTTYEYDLNSALTLKTLPNGGEYGYAYDVLSRIIKQSAPEGVQQKYAYDEFGNIKTVTDQSNRVTTYGFDKMHRMISVTNAKGNTEKYSYDVQDNVASFTTAKGNKTMYEYDLLDRLVSETNPKGEETSYSYDAASNIKEVQQFDRVYKYTQDKNGNITSAESATGKVRYFTYDSMGRLSGESDLKGKYTRYAYDLNGNLKSITDRRGGVTQYEYDSNGNMVKFTDAENRTSVYEYDLLDRIISVKEGDAKTAEYAYDSVSNLLSFTNGNGNKTEYSYDKLGNQKSIKDPLGNITSLSYNVNAKLERVINANGTSVSYDYDKLDALISKKYNDEDEATYTYDADGLVSSMTDVTGTTKYETDALGRLTKMTMPNGYHNVLYFYDKYGDLQHITYPSSDMALYKYDLDGMMTEISGLSGKATSFEYDENGNVTRVVKPNGTSTLIEYDDCDNVTALRNLKGTAVVSKYQYTYDLSGLITKETIEKGDDITERTYIYDNRCQILAVSERFTSDLGKTWDINNTEFTYDNAGNCLKESVKHGSTEIYNTVYTYDEADRLTNKTLNVDKLKVYTDYGYDLNGNVIKEDYGYNLTYQEALKYISVFADFTLEKGTKTYEYDSENRLVETRTNGVLTQAVMYDGNGNRAFVLNYKNAKGYIANGEGTGLNIKSSLQINTKEFISYNRSAVEKELLNDNGVTAFSAGNYELTGYVTDLTSRYSQTLVEYGANGKITNLYDYGVNRNSAKINGIMYYYSYDGRGSVSDLTNMLGNNAVSYSYDIYGKTKASNSYINNPYQYNAECTDSATGLQYLRARYYNADTHRFQTRDTYQGDIKNPLSRNGYAYANNSPVNFADPSGHEIRGLQNNFKAAISNVAFNTRMAVNKAANNINPLVSSKKAVRSTATVARTNAVQRNNNIPKTTKTQQMSSDAKESSQASSCDEPPSHMNKSISERVSLAGLPSATWGALKEAGKAIIKIPGVVFRAIPDAAKQIHQVTVDEAETFEQFHEWIDRGKDFSPLIVPYTIADVFVYLIEWDPKGALFSIADSAVDIVEGIYKPKFKDWFRDFIESLWDLPG